MRKRKIFIISFIIHVFLAIILNLFSMVWQMLILDSGGTTAPISLVILNYVALGFTLPIFLPIALALPGMGYADPSSDPIYLIALILNSALVAYFITWITLWRKK